MNLVGYVLVILVLLSNAKAYEGKLYLSIDGGWGNYYGDKKYSSWDGGMPLTGIEYGDSKRSLPFLYGLRFSQSCLPILICVEEMGDYLSIGTIFIGKIFPLSKSLIAKVSAGPGLAYGVAGEESLLGFNFHSQGKLIYILSDETTGIGIGAINEWNKKKSNLGFTLSYSLIFDYPIAGIPNPE